MRRHPNESLKSGKQIPRFAERRSSPRNPDVKERVFDIAHTPETSDAATVAQLEFEGIRRLKRAVQDTGP